MNMLINTGAFIILAVLWVGFGAALLVKPDFIDAVWQLFRGLPFVLQAIIFLLVLPVALGLWIWENS